jgi:hypothetical protein
MTESEQIAERPFASRSPSRAAFALGALALTAILLAVGAFSGEDDDVGYYLVALAIAAVTTAVVFWVIVPRITNLSVGALILAIIAAVTLVVFWLGIPVPFAAGAALLALEARGRQPGGNTRASVALVLAVLVVVAAILFAFIG